MLYEHMDPCGRGRNRLNECPRKAISAYIGIVEYGPKCLSWLLRALYQPPKLLKL